jgi:hypothetical protein
MMREGGGPGHAGSSRFAGVIWHKHRGKWLARCQEKQRGYHTTEEAAARAYSKYLKDGIVPVKRREANTSQFTGVSWDKNRFKWRVQCQGMYLSMHTTEAAAARAYDVEAKRRGITLNVIPPIIGGADAGTGPGPGAGGGAGHKRATLKKPATPTTSTKTQLADLKTLVTPAVNKKMKLWDTSPGAAAVRCVMAVLQLAKFDARDKSFHYKIKH